MEDSRVRRFEYLLRPVLIVMASLGYEWRQCDVEGLTPKRSASLVALMHHHRSQRDEQIAEFINTNPLCQKLLDNHSIRASAIRMEISRTRDALEGPLSDLGTRYVGKDVIPYPERGEGYRLACNWKVVHIAAPGTKKP